jgi:uncharacterized membrane protein YGL010W
MEHSSSLNALLLEYSESHQNPLNQKIHKICVPLIEWSVLGIIWSIPTPDFFRNITWVHIFVVFALLYYAHFKNLKVMLASLILMLPFWIYVSFHPPYILMTSLIVFILAWIGQFYGHKIEGKKPSFFRDIFFLLIGPLWVAEACLRKFGTSLNKI